MIRIVFLNVSQKDEIQEAFSSIRIYLLWLRLAWSPADLSVARAPFHATCGKSLVPLGTQG